MNLKILLTLFFLVLTISPLSFALDFGNVRNIIYRAKVVDFKFLVPFDGDGFPTSSPTWFSLSNFAVRNSVVSGFISQISRGEFKGRISILLNGQLDVNGNTKTSSIRFWSDATSNTTCPQFTDQKILCVSDKGYIKIYRQSYRWIANVTNYTLEVEDTGIGFRNMTVTGYEGENQLFKIVIVEDWFKFSYYQTSRKILRFAAVNGTIDYINPPANANPNIPFSLENFTLVKNFVDGKIIYNGGYAGSIQLTSIGAFNNQTAFDFHLDNQALRMDTSAYLVEKSFSDCPIFNSTDVYCKIRFGYMHTYQPSHEDQNLWKTFFNLMILNITHGRASISAGINDGTDFFKISDMNVTKLEMS